MNIFAKMKIAFDKRRKERKLKRLKLYLPLYCKIHGVTLGDRQGALAQTRAGDRLQAVHVPQPNYPYNIYIYSIPLNRVLGYLQEDLSEKLVKAFGENFCRDAVAENLTGEGYDYFGCNICIFDRMSYIDGEINFQALRGE